MNSLVRSSLFLRNNRKLCHALLARYSVDSGSQKHIDGLLKDKKVVVFMKGTKDKPMCGFSNAIVQIMNFHGVDFADHNVLSDEDLRQGIKDYTQWPTIPQVFIGGEFVGGTDILMEMHKSGDLIEELKKVGIKSVLLDKE